MYEFERTEKGWLIYWGPPAKESLPAAANDKTNEDIPITAPSPFSLADARWQGEPAMWLG